MYALINHQLIYTAVAAHFSDVLASPQPACNLSPSLRTYLSPWSSLWWYLPGVSQPHGWSLQAIQRQPVEEKDSSSREVTYLQYANRPTWSSVYDATPTFLPHNRQIPQTVRVCNPRIKAVPTTTECILVFTNAIHSPQVSRHSFLASCESTPINAHQACRHSQDWLKLVKYAMAQLHVQFTLPPLLT